LDNGIVYVGYASHGDNGPYHGWVVGYNTRDIRTGPVKVFNTSPYGNASGIWMSGGGLGFDNEHNLYLATGNGFGVGFTGDQAGPNSLGQGGGALGYLQINHSVSVRFRNFNPNNETGLGRDGAFDAGVPMPGYDFNRDAHASTPHTYRATLAYDGTTLTETVVDLNDPTRPTFNHSYPVNIPAIAGGTTAVVGFTGSTGGLNVQQDVQRWTYAVGGTTVIDHSSGFASHGDLTNNGNAGFPGTVARLTAAANVQTGSVFSNSRVDVSNFTTTFDFQLSGGSDPIADGMTFTIQNNVGMDWSESVLKLCTTATSQCPTLPPGGLRVADYFTPNDWRALDNADADLGSGGTMLLPDAVASAMHPHLVIETGKTGRMYLMDRANLGQNVPQGQADRVLQTVAMGGPGVWGNPSFFLDQPENHSGIIYYWGSGAPMRAFRITDGVINTTPIAVTNFTMGFPGSQPSISANSNSTAPRDGIVWALRVDNFGQNGPAELLAFNATNFQPLLFSSTATGQRDRFGNSVKFTFPIVSNGHVYAATNGFLSVFGLFPQARDVPAAPSDLSLTPLVGGTQMRLDWTNNAAAPSPATGVKIVRATDPTGPFTLVNTVARDVSTYTDTSVRPSTFYYYQVVATNQVGDSPSQTVGARARVAAPLLQPRDVCPGSISLGWTSTANDHYDIERGDAQGMSFELIATVPSSQTTYTDTNLPNGTFTYRVTGFSVFPEANDFAISNAAKATIGPIDIAHGTPGSRQPGFQDHSDMQSNGSGQFTSENLLRLTNDFGQAGSAFTLQPVGARGFTTSFDIRLHEGGLNPADGMTFTLQGNNPSALGGGGGGLGYQGIGRSVAVKFKIWQNPGDPSANTTGILFNGEDPTHNGINLDGTGINLRDQHPKQITLTYNGTTLTERIEDLEVPAVFTHDYTNVNIASVVGADTAFAGFTGATGGAFDLHDVLNWTYAEREETLPPRSPSNMRVTSVVPHNDMSDVSIAWNCNNAYTATSYHLERSTNGTTWGEIESGGVGVTTHTDTLPDGTYYYRVRFANDVGFSSYSNVTRILVPVPTSIDHLAGFATHSDLTGNGVTFTPNAMTVGTLVAHDDIGNVSRPGDATFSGGTYTLNAAGSDIWDVNDSFQFAYKRLTGDGSIVARVLTLGNTDFWAKGGIMMREGLDSNSRNVFMASVHQGTDTEVDFQWRTNTTGGTSDSRSGGAPAARPVYVRLVRSGNNFSASFSQDGMNWTQQGATQTIAMGNTIYVGLALTAHNNGAYNTSTFDNLTITGDTSASLPPTIARLTDGDFGEGRTVFSSTQVQIATFSTSFTYQVQPRVGSADGLAFVIQGSGANARGGSGGGLGYTGIGNSVAVKFDIWTSDTHRSTTGIYFDGEAPDSAAGRARQIFMDTDPANVIDFNNGHVFQIDLTYDGTTLAETVTDTVTGATFNTSYDDANITAHVGGNVGYVGLTGGTGGQTAIQDVLTWTYTAGGASAPSGGGVVGQAGGELELDVEHPSSPSGGPGVPTQAQVNDSALLVGDRHSLSSFSLDSATPLATLAERNDADPGTIPPAGRDAVTPAKPISADVSDPLAMARHDTYSKAVDQVFGAPELFSEL
jgi:hypothetical protein